VLDNPELMALVLPALRADFAMCEGYVASPNARLACPISVFGGDADTLERSELGRWREASSVATRIQMVPGDHFFFRPDPARFVRRLSEEFQWMGLLSHNNASAPASVPRLSGVA